MDKGFSLLRRIVAKIKYFKGKTLKEKQIATIKPEGISKGNILVSYLISPFRENKITISNKHTNEWECVKIVSLFAELGYTVDIINYNNYNFLPKKQYSYFLDIHSNMERLTPYLNRDCIKLLHITGSHWLFQNFAEYSRLLALQKRKTATLIPRRMALPSLGIENCDFASIIGNKITESTFSYSGKPIYRIHISTTKQFEFNEEKDFEKCKKNFLWFGGAGMVLKGLDISLEAFAEMSDFKLYVAGSVKGERDFEKLYEKELYHLENIITVGWIDVNSQKFEEIINNCIGVILPSGSEGTAGSVVTGMHAGLLPIVSEEAGVDIFDFGLIIKNKLKEDIQESIRTIANMPDAELKQMSHKAWTYARKYHTRERFEQDYRTFLIDIVHFK